MALEKEHIEVANEMVQGKVKLASLQDENETLNMQVSEMRRITGDEDLEALMDLRQDNERLVAENEQLQSQMTEMKQELDEIRESMASLMPSTPISNPNGATCASFWMPCPRNS